jgi:stage II sporulation protein D
MTRKIFSIAFIALILFMLQGYLYGMGDVRSRIYIPLRVLVVGNTEDITLRVKGGYKILDVADEKILKEGVNLEEQQIFARDIFGTGIKISGGDRSRIYINGRQFRGSTDIIKNEDKKILVVNHIDLEEYLLGVLYHEVSHHWPIEVLKAQAIAARTYAFYQKLTSKNKYYDLSSDIYSQVYGGRKSETWRTTKAVNMTQGLVLTFNDKIFPAYYHATCGGQTSDVTTLWNIDVPALRGKVCEFCKTSPHYQWKKEFRLEDIQKKLREGGYDIDIISFEVLKRDVAGRVLEIEIKGGDGSVKLNGNKFRLLLGPNIIKSTNFEIQVRGRYVMFYGKGWGHGIGMCQWGAFGMARQGYKAEEILEYYYPGAKIVELE